MKKLLFASLLVAGSVVAVNAQEAAKDSASVSTSTETTVQGQGSSSSAVEDGVSQIKTEELPAPVKTALESPEYKGWIINAASLDKKEELYHVELKNGADTKKVKFNKDGKAVSE